MLRRANNKLITIHHQAQRRFVNTTAAPAISVVLVGPSQPLQRQQGRSFSAAATSREKRALNDQQLKGTTTAAPSAGAGSAANQAGPPPSTPSTGVGGGGGTVLPMLAVLAAAGGGAAYYFDLLPGSSGDKQKPTGGEEKDLSEKSVTVVETDIVETIDKDGKVKDELIVTEGTVSDGRLEDVAVTVVNVTPEKDTQDAEQPRAMPVVSEDPETQRRSKKEAVQVNSEVAEVAPAVAHQAAALEESKIMQTLQELKAELNARTDKALTEAHRELAKLSSLNMNDLEKMTETQLKVRLVQMAKDMEEQVKWEAVRLQEFLALKEREVEDK